jgi:hypothetical protein
MEVGLFLTRVSLIGLCSGIMRRSLSDEAATFQNKLGFHWMAHARWPIAQVHSLTLEDGYRAKCDLPDRRAIPQDDVEVRFTTKSGPMSIAERRKLFEAAYRANFCRSSAINYSEAALHKTIRGSVSLLFYPCPGIEDDWRKDNIGGPYSREALPADEGSEWRPASADSDSDPDTEYVFNTSARDRAVWKDYEEDERSAERSAAEWDAYVPPPVDPYAVTPIKAGDGLDFLFWDPTAGQRKKWLGWDELTY